MAVPSRAHVELSPLWIAEIATGSLSTKAISPAMAEVLIRHNLATAIAALIPPELPPSAAESKILAAHQRGIMQMMAAVALTQRLSRLLAQAGIQHIFLKGAPLAVQTLGAWGWRSSCDVDLLIDPRDYHATHRVFKAAGFVRQDRRRAPAGWFFQWAICEVCYVGASVEIDLHWRLDSSPSLFKSSFNKLLARSDLVELEGREIRTLGRIDAWLFTAVHGMRSDWVKWSMLLDLYRQAEKLAPAERIQARAMAKAEGCAIPLVIAEALLEQCDSKQASPATNNWGRDRASRIIAETAGGDGPNLSLKASILRRMEISYSIEGNIGKVSSLARALGRAILHPDHYIQHIHQSI